MRTIKAKQSGFAPLVQDDYFAIRGFAPEWGSQDAAAVLPTAATNAAPTFRIIGYPIARVSTGPSGEQANGLSADATFSSNGRLVIFQSTAANLVNGDTNGNQDIFVKNLVTGSTGRLSTGSQGGQANGNSSAATMSADRTKLVFESTATNFVAGDTNGNTDIFVKDLTTGAVTLVSSTAAGAFGNGFSFGAVFSPDGTKVAFTSGSNNLVAGDTNGSWDVFVKDLATGAITMASTGSAGGIANAPSTAPVFSPDGTKLIFESEAGNLVAGDTNGRTDLFLKDLLTGALTRISTGQGGVEGNHLSSSARFSPDGTKVIFHSFATNFVAGDTNSNLDIFIKDLATGAISLVSTNEAGVQGDWGSSRPVFSPDGTQVAFYSFATNLVPNDTNSNFDVFVKDLITGVVTRLSVSLNGVEGNGQSLYPLFSPDGASVLFRSDAGTLVAGDTNLNDDIFVAELKARFTENGMATRVFPPILVADSDSDNYGGGSLTAVITTDAVAGDTLGFSTAGAVTLEGDQLSVHGVVVGTVSGGGTSLSVALNANATDFAVEAITQNLTFATESEDPTRANRTVTLTLVDGGGAATSLSRDVAVSPVNDAPVLTASPGISAYVEGADAPGTPVVVDPGFVITDVDSSRITDATIQMIVGGGGDLLGFVNNDASLFGDIFVVANFGSIQLGSNGGATRDQWQNALRAITYTSTDDMPFEGDRTVAFIVVDRDETGQGIFSNYTSRQLSLTAVNDSPINHLPGAQSMEQDAVLTFSAAGGNAIIVSDPDTIGSSMRVTLSVADGALALTSGWIFVEGQGTSTLTLFAGSAAQLNAALDGLTYTPPAGFQGSRAISVVTGDGGGGGTVNRIVNGGAEAGEGAADLVSSVTPSGWTAVAGNLTALRYDAAGGDLEPIGSFDGDDYFAGGPGAGSSAIRQVIDVSDRAADIDAGLIHANVSGEFGGRGADDDAMVLSIRFLAQGGAVLGTAEVGGVLAAPRGGQTLLLPRDVHPVVPAGTRAIELVLTANHVSGGYNDAYAERLVLTLDKLDSDSIAVTILPNDDVLAGTPGADNLAGGRGDDIYIVNHEGDLVFEAAGEGNDIIYSGLSHALTDSSEVESLSTLSWESNAALNLTGNGLANTLIGNAGANQLNGRGGSDVMIGREGNDIYIADSTGDQAVEGAGQGIDIVYSAVSYALNDSYEVENLSTISWEATTAINLTGNGLANTLIGNAGANQLNGRGGNDVMIGREGNDIYIADSAADAVIEAAGQGIDTVYSAVSYALNDASEVEALATLSFEGTGAINLTGNGLANTLIGNDGNNQLDGRSGADVMVGRAGGDIYLVDHATDAIFESVGGGYDVIYSAMSFALTNDQEIEGISTITWELTTAVDLTGNSADNYLIGNAGTNVLDGKGGSDVLQGREGTDTFAFTIVPGAGHSDLILDFSAADDTIRLEGAAFGGLPAGPLNPNAFVTGSAAQDTDDRIVYNQATGQLFFDADGSGNGAAVLFAVLQGAPVITANDFAVI